MQLRDGSSQRQAQTMSAAMPAGIKATKTSHRQRPLFGPYTRPIIGNAQKGMVAGMLQ